MREVTAVRRLGWLMICALAVSGCSSPTQQPANLSLHKRQIRDYVDRGQYMRDLEVVAVRASTWIEQRAVRGGEKLTVVFDLDETLFFNWPHISAMDFGYVVTEWDRWVDEAKAPAIEPVREVYRTARRRGVDVVFITGRPESQREATVRNLRAIDCGDFAALICKPPGQRGGTVAYKTGAREQLVREGRTIIANIGDQHSDLAGGAAERTFKLPNVFYQLD